MRKTIEWGGEAGPMNQCGNDRAAPRDSVIMFLKIATLLLLAGVLVVLFLELKAD